MKFKRTFAACASAAAIAVSAVGVNAFVSNNSGLSSAVSIVIFGFIVLFSLFTNRGVKEKV